MMKRSFCFLVLTAWMCTSLHAQNEAGFRFLKNIKIENNIGYNFFMGQDAADFQTSIKGFGSGFGDILTGRVTVDLVSFGNDQINLSLGLGQSTSKFRFSKNLLLEHKDGMVNWMEDADDTHDYVNTFFGYGKTKLVNASVYAPIDLNFRLGEQVHVYMGGFVDYSFYTKFKSKYKIGEDKIKELIKPSEMRNYNLNALKYGLNAGFFHKKWDVGVAVTYYLTPFFQTGNGPDLNEFRIAVLQGVGDLSKILKEI